MLYVLPRITNNNAMAKAQVSGRWTDAPRTSDRGKQK